MDYIVKHGEAFCKDIADAINMKEIPISKSTVKKAEGVPANIPNSIRVDKPKWLSTVAKQYGVSLSHLIKINDFKKNTKLKKGQLIYLKSNTSKKKAPKPSVSRDKTEATTHTVKPNETLWGIAQRYNISVDKLKSLNGLKSNVIHVGDKLKVKAVSSTSVKQKSPVKATAQNVRNKRTKTEAVAYAKSLEGKGLDFDNFAGWQCFDTANFYWNFMFGHGLKGVGAKDIPTWNDFTGEATIHKNTPEFLAEPGDLVVWGGTYGNGYGHVAVVISATLNSITVVEQNWLNGGANKTERTTKRVHSYDTNMWFIRPIFK